MQKCKVLAYKTHRKIRGKFVISSAPYNAKREWKCAPYHRKGEEAISDFDQKVKIFKCPIWFFKKFAQQRIERKEARGGFRINLKGFKIPKLKGG